MSNTTGGFGKISITIYVHGSAEEATNVKENLEMTKGALNLAFTHGLFGGANELLKIAGQLLAVADLNVIRVEPDQRTQTNMTPE